MIGCLVLADPNQVDATKRAVSAAKSILGVKRITLLAPEGLFNTDNAPCDVVSAPASCFSSPEAASSLLNHVAGSGKENRPTHVLAPMTPFGRAVLPRAAAAASVPCVTDVIKFDGPKRLLRHAAAGRTLETLEVNGAFAIILVFCLFFFMIFVMYHCCLCCTDPFMLQ